ncbi:hypothetical protein Nepgr_016138 [Nepenthes gracilis]|uniref:Uncharacterized protein n=1 Tax=Nepenthes gracilis TaxID=150966 RepID=A0AAD3SPL9_NEPGR|nr:hypothetical protein Nepgr_016138 [Nepenthes gracilis]
MHGGTRDFSNGLQTLTRKSFRVACCFGMNAKFAIFTPQSSSCRRRRKLKREFEDSWVTRKEDQSMWRKK